MKKRPTDIQKEEFIMIVANVEYEKEQYYLGLKNYYERLKAMPSEEAQKEARRNLQGAGIIDKRGKLTKQYK